MPPTSRNSRIRPIVLWTTACALVVVVLVYFGSYGIPRLHQKAFSHLRPPPSPPPEQPGAEDNAKDDIITPDDWVFDHRRDSKNYGLSAGQCVDAFPLLYQEIDRAVEHRRKVGNVTAKEVEVAWRETGIVRAMIRNNELYIIQAQGVWRGDDRLRSLATLGSLNRAITSYQGRLPNIEFSLTVGDPALVDPASDYTTWSYSRLLPYQETLWLMPGYGFWGSPATGMRSYSEFRSILDDSEDDFLDKIPKLVWRGTLDVTGSDVRKALLKESEDQDWSDAKTLDWKNETSVMKDLISMEDHCAYMFAAETGGNAQAGRLKYLWNCNNVVVAHESSWIEHFHHLLAPSGDYQNYVKLKSDFSDLRKTMKDMLQPETLQDRGRLIADNARKMFRERYLTPAAEACYWRALIRGWASVQGFEPQLWTESEQPDWHEGGSEIRIRRRPRGVPFESYALMEDVEWDIPAESRHICMGN